MYANFIIFLRAVTALNRFSNGSLLPPPPPKELGQTEINEKKYPAFFSLA